jgi:hypothetical protein
VALGAALHRQRDCVGSGPLHLLLSPFGAFRSLAEPPHVPFSTLERVQELSMIWVVRWKKKTGKYLKIFKSFIINKLI